MPLLRAAAPGNGLPVSREAVEMFSPAADSGHPAASLSGRRSTENTDSEAVDRRQQSTRSLETAAGKRDRVKQHEGTSDRAHEPPRTRFSLARLLLRRLVWSGARFPGSIRLGDVFPRWWLKQKQRAHLPKTWPEGRKCRRRGRSSGVVCVWLNQCGTPWSSCNFGSDS